MVVLYNDGFFPWNYVVNEEFPQPIVHVFDELNILVRSLDSVLDPAPNLWDDEHVVNFRMRNEEWTVGKATLEEEKEF